MFIVEIVSFCFCLNKIGWLMRTKQKSKCFLALMTLTLDYILYVRCMFLEVRSVKELYSHLK